MMHLHYGGHYEIADELETDTVRKLHQCPKYQYQGRRGGAMSHTHAQWAWLRFCSAIFYCFSTAHLCITSTVQPRTTGSQGGGGGGGALVNQETKRPELKRNETTFQG